MPPARGFVVSGAAISVLGVLTALAGGVGRRRFLAGLVDVVEPSTSPWSSTPATTTSSTACGSAPTSTASPTPSPAPTTPRPGGASPGETFDTMDALDRYGDETWFRLGDRDLATHLYRTRRLREGAPLTR